MPRPLVERAHLPEGLVKGRKDFMDSGESSNRFYEQWSTLEMPSDQRAIADASWAKDKIAVDFACTLGDAEAHRDMLSRRWGSLNVPVEIVTGRTIPRVAKGDHSANYIPVATVGGHDLCVIRLKPERVAAFAMEVGRLTSYELCLTKEVNATLSQGQLPGKRAAIFRGAHKGVSLARLLEVALSTTCQRREDISLYCFSDKHWDFPLLTESTEDFAKLAVDLRRVSRLCTNINEAAYATPVELKDFKGFSCKLGPQSADTRQHFGRRKRDNSVKGGRGAGHRVSFPGTRKFEAFHLLTAQSMSMIHGGVTLHPLRERARRSSSSTSASSSESDEGGARHPHGRVRLIRVYNR